MTTTLTDLAGYCELELSNGAFQHLIRHGVFLPAGVCMLDASGDTLWVPDGWSGSAHDGWTIQARFVPAMREAVRALHEAHSHGVEKGRPWVTDDIRKYVATLPSVLKFLGACSGFVTG